MSFDTMNFEKDYFLELAAYNRWANGLLYDVVATLDEADYLADRGAFFGSMHRTLCHIYVGDAIWMGRMNARPARFKSLDAAPFDDFASLRAGRQEMDEHIEDTVRRIAVGDVGRAFPYHDIAGNEQSVPLCVALAHVFNHETHHRGQVHDMLSQLGKEAPAIDLIYYHIAQKG